MNEKVNETNEVNELASELRTINVEQLIAHAMHPRQDIGDVKSLKESIKLDGLQEPILVHALEGGNFEVLDGLRRLEAIKNLKHTEVNCLVKSGLTPEVASRISYVKNVERKSLTPIEIARYLKKLKDTFGFSHSDLAVKGYGSTATVSNVLKLLDLPEEVQDLIHRGKLTPAHGKHLLKLSEPEVQKSMAARFIDHDLSASRASGHVANYLKKIKMAKQISNVEIPKVDIPNVYFKDARDMSELPDESVHLVLTSPPYGVGMEYEKGLSLEDVLSNNYAVLEESCRVLVPGGIMAINVVDINSHKNKKGIREIILVASGYQKTLRKHGVYLSEIVIWHKQRVWSKRNQLFNQNTRHASYRILDNFEPVYVFRKEGDRQEPEADIVERSILTNDQWKECVDGVWNIRANTSQEGHPTPWPDELPTRLIKMFSFIGDTVLDPFLGSGTTIKVAQEMGRLGVGYEIQEKYKPVIMKKLGVEDIQDTEEIPSAAEAAAKAVEAKPQPEFFTNIPAIGEDRLLEKTSDKAVHAVTD